MALKCKGENVREDDDMGLDDHSFEAGKTYAAGVLAR